MFRAVICILALGTTGAFQAPRNGWVRSTTMMSTNDLYGPGAAAPMSRVEERKAEKANLFGGTFDSSILVQGGSL
eukprot:CAMPEP_0205920882 /NCGR_PEP_ID=MMETSP1325-20131115/11910_1 /ASSEMBLY_ACC=CAM_ASM_000708 /TAXON_ID=236786 /ORGANISM="Florenciella sp., Strain RCC1007" /LENGTH=74 /DNA_ID=CAMNT_0053288617 /DNA_START=56 /DNA_END=276 /DNA_ORIENTATION=+